MRTLHACQGGFTKRGFLAGGFLIHAGKPLRGCTVDNWCLVSPAMHVGVRIGFILQKAASLIKRFDNIWVRFPNMLSSKEGQR